MGSTITVSTLSKQKLLMLSSQYNKLPNTYKYKIVEASLVYPGDIDELIYDDIDVLHSEILDRSLITAQELEDISTGILTIKDEKYSSPDYRSCKLCQEKNLDTYRNCPMLDEKTHSKSVFFTFTDDNKKLERQCPMYKVNNSPLIQSAIDLLNMLELNQLPLSGGMLDQTYFVNEVSTILKPTIISNRRVM